MHVDGLIRSLRPRWPASSRKFDKLSAFFDIVEQDPVISCCSQAHRRTWDEGSGGYQVGGLVQLVRMEWPLPWIGVTWRSQPSTLPEFASRLMGSSDLYQMNGPSGGFRELHHRT